MFSWEKMHYFRHCPHYLRHLNDHIIGILEKIDSFYWPKMHFLKMCQTIWTGPGPALPPLPLPPPSFGQCNAFPPQENVPTSDHTEAHRYPIFFCCATKLMTQRNQPTPPFGQDGLMLWPIFCLNWQDCLAGKSCEQVFEVSILLQLW